jgi:hypothetical protein
MTDFDEMRRQLNLLSAEELISIVRERDQDQWRPEVFDIARSILNERGISPGEESRPEEAVFDEVFPDEAASPGLVTIANYMNYADAVTDRLALEANGLKVWLLNEHVYSESSFQPGIQLQVREEDLPAAIQILESEPVPSSDLPAEIAEPPCPKCSSRKVTEGAEIVEPSAASNRSSLRQAWLYHCASCGYKWTES